MFSFFTPDQNEKMDSSPAVSWDQNKSSMFLGKGEDSFRDIQSGSIGVISPRYQPSNVCMK
jgi:hypothetical protein